MVVAENMGDVVLEALLSDLTKGCDVGEALIRDVYAPEVAYE